MNAQILQSETFQKMREKRELAHQASSVAKTYVQQLLEPLVKNDDDLEWLRSSFITSSYEHICFRYRNNVYSVMIDLRDGDKSILQASDFKAQIYDSKIHRFIPCIIPLDKNTLLPIYPDSILLDTRNLQPIFIEAGEKTEMAAWEIRYQAYKLVRTYILNNNWKVAMLNSTGKEPVIMFLDARGVKSYVIIKPHFSGSEITISNKQIMPKFKGYFADVEILADKETKLWRNNPVPYKFEGLEPIEKKIEEGIFVDPETIKQIYRTKMNEEKSVATYVKPVDPKESFLEKLTRKMRD